MQNGCKTALPHGFHPLPSITCPGSKSRKSISFTNLGPNGLEEATQGLVDELSGVAGEDAAGSQLPLEVRHELDTQVLQHAAAEGAEVGGVEEGLELLQVFT